MRTHDWLFSLIPAFIVLAIIVMAVGAWYRITHTDDLIASCKRDNGTVILDSYGFYDGCVAGNNPSAVILNRYQPSNR